jgi:uncharacterized protein (TIGR02453 family)
MDFKSLLRFLTQLSKNNTKEWFDTHRAEYETLRKQWIGFAHDMILKTASFDAHIAPLEPRQCIFRINRDIRFSKNKQPYKTNFGLSLSKTARRDDFCGYYLHVEPGKSFAAVGSYMPQPPVLAAIRQEIDYNAASFEKIVKSRAFQNTFGKLDGEQLTRPPQGYDSDNAAIEWLKHKSFVGTAPLSDADLCDKNFDKKLLNIFETGKPLNDFLFVAYQQHLIF